MLIGVAVDLVVQREGGVLAQFVGGTLYYQLFVLGGLTAVIWVLESIFEYWLTINWRFLAQKMQHDLRVRAYAHLQKLDLSWYAYTSTGDILSILNDDINQLERFLDTGLTRLIQVLVTSVVIGGIFFFLSAQVAVFAVLPIPLIIYGSLKFQNQLAVRYQAVRNSAGLIAAKLTNNIQGILTIKAYTQELYENQQISRLSQSYSSSNHHAIRLSSLVVPAIRMAILCGFGVTLVYGGILTLEGHLAIGSYSVLIFLTQRLLWPFTLLGETFDLLQRALASTDRVDRLLATPVRMNDLQANPTLKVDSGRLSFINVSFAYEPDHLVLKNIHFSVGTGKYLGIVGPTGSGKSTLVKLILRFYSPSEGQVAVDGHSVDQFLIERLRKSIGLVSQEVFIFQGSIFENISYGVERLSEAQLQVACKGAEIWDFICSLKDGLDTQIGERGMRLSGGQRQRIAIARALLKDPPIFIFDEATSAVDNETEALIQRSIMRLKNHRTVIVIAHRLSTVRRADEIITLEDGEIRERGSHEELILQGGLYQRLWAIQTGE